MSMVTYGYGYIWLCLHKVMVTYGYGYIWLWLHMAMITYDYCYICLWLHMVMVTYGYVYIRLWLHMRKGKDPSSWLCHTQTVSCLSHTALTWVQCQANQCWICGGQSVTGTGLSSNNSKPAISVTTCSSIYHRPYITASVNSRNTHGSNI